MKVARWHLANLMSPVAENFFTGLNLTPRKINRPVGMLYNERNKVSTHFVKMIALTKQSCCVPVFLLLVIVYCLGWSFGVYFCRESCSGSLIANSSKSLVLYAYYETALSKSNLLFFLRHGILHPSRADFVFIVNGAHSVAFPFLPNVFVFLRNNTCFDIGSYGIAYDKYFQSAYRFFILMNGSVRGPFLPRWVPFQLDYLHIFTSQIDDRVKLVGTSSNCFSLEQRHLQSMFLVTDSVGMSILRPLMKCFVSWTEAVFEGEILLSKTLIKLGYHIRSQLLCESSLDVDVNCTHGDLFFPHAYAGFDIHPLEVIFFKNNRGVTPSLVERYSEWLDRRARF